MKRPKRNENQMPERMNIWCSYEENITEYWEENGEKCEDEYTNSGVHELFLNNKKDYLIMKSLMESKDGTFELCFTDKETVDICTNYYGLFVEWH